MSRVLRDFFFCTLFLVYIFAIFVLLCGVFFCAIFLFDLILNDAGRSKKYVARHAQRASDVGYVRVSTFPHIIQHDTNFTDR